MTSLSSKERWRGGKGYTHNKEFYSDICFFGWDGFDHEVIAEGLCEEDAKRLETRLISEFRTTEPQNGYNKSFGVTMTGMHRTEDEKHRISVKLKGRTFSEIHRLRISLQSRGTNHPGAKAVYQYSKTGEFIKKWDYMNLAAETLNIKKQSISQNCNGKRKSAGGFVWSY